MSEQHESLESFRHFREKMNEAIHSAGNLTINRFFALDARTYEPGALDGKTKELMGLTASMVLRCDDCITYHLIRCREEGATDDELFEAFSVALVVGGSIVIPHLRRAVSRLQEMPAS
jgi:AhpD family alkylhydroperoxidase